MSGKYALSTGLDQPLAILAATNQSRASISKAKVPAQLEST